MLSRLAIRQMRAAVDETMGTFRAGVVTGVDLGVTDVHRSYISDSAPIEIGQKGVYLFASVRGGIAIKANPKSALVLRRDMIETVILPSDPRIGAVFVCNFHLCLIFFASHNYNRFQ